MIKPWLFHSYEPLEKLQSILNPLAFLSLRNNGRKMIKIVHRNLPGVSNMAEQGRIILQNYCVCNLSNSLVKVGMFSTIFYSYR